MLKILKILNRVKSKYYVLKEGIYLILLITLFSGFLGAEDAVVGVAGGMGEQDDVIEYFGVDKDSKIEYFEKGFINWTEGSCIGYATENDLEGVSYEDIPSIFASVRQRNEAQSKLIQTAKTNLLNIILATRIDGTNYTRDYYAKSKAFKSLFLSEIDKNIVILPTVFKSPNKVIVALKYSLRGKRGLEGLIYRLDDNVEERVDDVYQKEPHEQIIYTSLIIDLRQSYRYVLKTYERLYFLEGDIKIPPSLEDKVWYDNIRKRLISKDVLTLEDKSLLMSLRPNDRYYASIIDNLYRRSKSSRKVVNGEPALFPSIYDSEGHKIYFKNLLKLKKRGSVKFINYTKDKYLMYKVERVGVNPLYVVADKVVGINGSNIVLGKEDSIRLLQHPKTMENLMEGNIYVLLK